MFNIVANADVLGGPEKLADYGIVGAVVLALVWLIFWQYRTIREQIRANESSQVAARAELRDFVNSHRSETSATLSNLASAVKESNHEISEAVGKMTENLAENSRSLQFLGVFVQSVVRLAQDGSGKKMNPQDLATLARAVRQELAGG